MSSSARAGRSQAICDTLQHRADQRLVVDRRAAAVAGQQGADLRLRDQVARQPVVERRQAQRAVLAQFDRRAAFAEQHRGPEHRVARDADDQFVRAGPAGHRLHREAQHLGLRLLARHALAHADGRGAHFVHRREAERHAADVRLVDDLRRQDLERHRKADLRGGEHRLLGVARAARVHHRDAVGLQQRLGLLLVQPLAARLQRLVQQRLRARLLGPEVVQPRRRAVAAAPPGCAP